MKSKVKATEEFLIENVLSVIIECGKETAKRQMKEVIAEGGVEIAAMVGIDFLGSVVPGIGNAISSYRIQKQMNNLSTFIIELEKRINEIQSNLENQTPENKHTLDSMLEVVIEKSANTNQSEKIKYMINGFTNLTKVENISYDVSYLYYDVMEKMTILDIAVLKLSYFPIIDIDGYDGRKNYLDVMEEFNINHYQYNSVKQNLDRIGLLENVYDDILEKDLNSLILNVNNLNKSVISIQEALEDPRKMRKISKIKKSNTTKLKAKDRLKTSKFGREFTEFFIGDNHSF